MAPQYLIAFTGAIKPTVGIITSSFDFTLDKIKLICSADVPELTAIAYFEFVILQICFSKASINLPDVEIQFVLIHSLRFFFSLPLDLVHAVISFA